MVPEAVLNRLVASLVITNYRSKVAAEDLLRKRKRLIGLPHVAKLGKWRQVVFVGAICFASLPKGDVKTSRREVTHRLELIYTFVGS